MSARKFTVIGLVALVALFFYLGMNAYQKRVQTVQDVQVKAEQTRLVRMHSPVISAVELLKAFLVSTTLTGEQMGWKIAIHLTFVISGLLFAASDWISDNRKNS